MTADTFTLLQDVLKKAQGFGASAADIVLSDSSSVTVNRRLGQPESVLSAEESEIGLRVFCGRRQALVSSSDRSRDALFAMAERAVAMAKLAPADPFAGIAEAGELAQNFPELDLYDATELSVEQMNEIADRGEQAALSVAGITNSDRAEFSTGKDTTYFLATNGFAKSYSSSGFTLGVMVIAGKDAEMEVEDEFCSVTHFADLKSPELVGRVAGERAVAALSPRKAKTKKLPVVFDRRVAGGLIGSLSGAISGSAVARGTTLLKDKMGAQVFSKNITVTDDPFIRRGHRSHPFDGEGLAPQKRNMIDAGVLTGWLLDLSSARQLNLKSTGNATRGTGSLPSPRPANFTLQPGPLSPAALIAGIDEGFLVTMLMGSGANIITGDYSRGARGFWIEKGRIAYPVSEVTIAGNLKEMWMNMTPANDLELQYGIDAPTTLVDGLTVAGG